MEAAGECVKAPTPRKDPNSTDLNPESPNGFSMFRLPGFPSAGILALVPD